MSTFILPFAVLQCLFVQVAPPTSQPSTQQADGETPPAVQVLEVQLDGTGRLTVKVEYGVEQRPPQPGGDPVELGRLVGASATRRADGVFSIWHEFNHEEEIETFAATNSARIERGEIYIEREGDRGFLVVRPPTGQPVDMISLSHPRRLRLPARIRLTLDPVKDTAVGLQVFIAGKTASAPVERLDVGIFQHGQAPAQVRVQHVTLASREREQQVQELLQFAVRVKGAQLHEAQVRISPRQREMGILYVGLGVAGGEARVDSLNIEAAVAGRLGTGFKLLPQGVVVSALSESATAASELQLGDIVRQVNGRSIRTVDDALNELLKAVPGQSVTFSIRRGTESLAVNVVAD